MKIPKPSKAHRLAIGVLFSLVTLMTTSLAQIRGQSLGALPFIALTNADLGNVYQLSWRPDGAILAVASESGVWLFTPELLSVGQLVGHTDRVLSVDWNSTGAKLATGSSDSTVRIWDMAETSPTYLTTIEVFQLTKPVTYVAWNPVEAKQELARSIIERTEFYSDGATVYSSVQIWDVTQGILKHRLDSDVPDLAYSVAWNPNGEQLVTASLKMGQGYQISLWNTTSGELGSSSESSLYRINSIAWRPNRRNFAVGTDYDLAIFTDSLGFIFALPDGRDDSIEPIYVIDWNLEGTIIAMGTETGYLQLWDVAVGERLAILQAHTGKVDDTEWSPDNVYLATLSLSDGLRIWDVTNLPSLVGTATITPYPAPTPTTALR